MTTNGDGSRHLDNWIGAFIDNTANIHTPAIFRQWTAISVIAAALEQKVWLRTSRPLYPNLYTFIIAHPGVGKSRIIAEGRTLYQSLPEPHLAPISMTFASMVDALARSQRKLIIQPGGDIEYHSMFICADEMGTFIHKYEPEMIDGLSAFYDASDYSQERRGMEKKIKMKSVQTNILAGSTPTNLLGFMPEKAWGQGFTSRIILVFSDERIIPDDFAQHNTTHTKDLIHDLKIINSLHGEFMVTEDFVNAVKSWQALGEPPIPEHPKLTHYITRRRIHIYRLAMISSINRSSGLVLTEADFIQGLEWLVAAEHHMPDIFKAGTVNADSQAMDEIQHFVRINDLGTGVSELRINNFARERVPLTSILRIIEIMESTGMITVKRRDRLNTRFYEVPAKLDPFRQISDPAAGSTGPSVLQ